jgi:MFS family permease
MLTRFSLYGFLKNQRYYEPFIILAFRDKGLSFFLIGLLIGFRQLWVNILEIPSGFLADTFGRRRSMIVSFVAYIASFAIFAMSSVLWTLFLAMFFFAIGEAFRTGTHKAMIFDWLKSEGRTNERTKIYGFTRSWSQLGSAISVILATIAVLVTENYTIIFWLSIIPYVAAIVNFLGYPLNLDGKPPVNLSFADLWRNFIHTLKGSMRNRPLRRIFLESAVYRGNASLAKDYLQPLLGAAALTLPFWNNENPERRSALLVGFIFFLLYLFSSGAARNAYRFVKQTDPGGASGEACASQRLWITAAIAFTLAAIVLLAGWNLVAGAIFAFIVVMVNIWRPILMSRIDAVSDSKSGATILSIEAQAGSVYLMVSAPLLGLAADKAGLWAVAVFGGITALAFTFAGIMKKNDSPR